jgi:hypothetical protein
VDITIEFFGPYKPQWVLEPYRPDVVVLGVNYSAIPSTIDWYRGNVGNKELPTFGGVYLVTNRGDPVYAGQAKYGVRSRFKQKASGIHELGLVRDVVGRPERQEVWAGEPTAWHNTGQKAAIKTVETWLIRYLLVRDFTRNPANRKFVNLDKTVVATAHATGMQLTFEGPIALRRILWDPTLCDENNVPVALPAGGTGPFTYRYGANAPF